MAEAMKSRHQRLLEYADPILAVLRMEAQQERAAMDDDLPHQPEPSPLASAQSRRAHRLSEVA